MKPRIQWFLLPLVLMPIAGLIFLGITQKSKEEKSRVFGTVPSFSLTERNGTSFSSDDLRGKTWVANFIFTRCSGQCPMLNKKMQKLQRKFSSSPDFRLVSFSVDPGNDTPQTLKKYATRFGADEEKWRFLTGNRDKVKWLLEDGFKVATGDMSDLSVGPITHSDKLVLVDRWGRIRGYYEGSSPRAFRKLQSRVRSVLLERF